MPWPNALRALRHRNYRYFYSGQFISLVGTWMQTVAESWLVYRLTHSSLLLGLTGFASQIPVFLLAPIGGTIADALDRRKILITTQSLAMLLALTYAGLTLSGHIRVWQIITIAALLGIVNAVDIPTRQAFVVDMVAREDLINAIALNSSMFNGARVVGPAIAGILVAIIGEGWCFLANGLSYIAVITGLALMYIPRRQRSSGQSSALSNVVQGFKFVFGTAPVRALILLLGVTSLFGMPYAVLMPIFADQILHVGSKGLGLLMGFSGVGALCGAVALAFKQRIRGLGQWITLGGLGFGIAVSCFAYSRTLWLSCLALVFAGFCMMVQMASSNTLIQSMVPDHLRGRVMAIYAMMFMGMAPVGSLIAGALAQHITAPLTAALGGALCMVGAGIFGLNLGNIRPLARELIIAQQTQAAVPPIEQSLATEDPVS